MPRDEEYAEEPNEDVVRGMQAAYTAFGQEIKKRSGCSDDEWKEIVKEVTDAGGNPIDLAEKALGKREATSEEKHSGVNPAKEAMAKDKVMSKADVEKAYGEGDISREAYEESGHASRY